jgi:AcrR family transcriptional regulator
MSAAAPTRSRAVRSDGEQSRERLLHSALALFAQHGYAKTSTRDIADAAGTNLAAISYYFGDKAGLYRAVFVEPMGDPADELGPMRDPSLTLGQALRVFYAGFVEPLRHGDLARQCMKLHMREMVEPTGLFEDELARTIRPSHEALVAVLCRHLGVPRSDDDLLRLAVCIVALGVHLHVGREVTDLLAPNLNRAADSVDLWLERMVLFATAMVEAERGRCDGASRADASAPLPMEK